MSYLAKVCIDHSTIYCKDAQPLNRLFSALGFYSKNQVHYMTPNSYFELYQPRSVDETYPFFQSDAGLHSFIFWSDDIDDCFGRVVEAGYVTAMPVSDFSRPADHGEPRGEAQFRGFYMQTELLPIGETAVVQQMTPELIYPAKPYPHPNTVVGMDRMFLCVPQADQEAAVGERLEKFCDVLRKGRPAHDCITQLEVNTPQEVLDKYGVQVDPTRSCCTGIRFFAADLNAVRGYVEKSGLKWNEKDGLITVDLSEAANLFMQFRQK